MKSIWLEARRSEATIRCIDRLLRPHASYTMTEAAYSPYYCAIQASRAGVVFGLGSNLQSQNKVGISRAGRELPVTARKMTMAPDGQRAVAGNTCLYSGNSRNSGQA